MPPAGDSEENSFVSTQAGEVGGPHLAPPSSYYYLIQFSKCFAEPI